MNKKTSIALTILVVGLLIVAIGQRINLNEAQNELCAVMTSPDTATAVSDSGSTSESKVSQGHRSDDGESELALQADPKPDKSEKKKQKKGKRSQKDMMAYVARRLQDNALLRRLAHTQMGREVAKDYTDLFRLLNLSPKQVKQFSSLLQKQYTLAMDAFIDADGDLAAMQNNEELATKLGEQEAALEDEIRAFLGEEDFALYQQYLEDLPYRKQLAGLKKKLYGADMDLSAEQELALISIMKEESRLQLQAMEDPELFRISTKLPEERDMKEQEIHLRQLAVRHQRYLDAADGLLSEEQLLLFEEHLWDMKDLTEAMMAFMPEPEGTPSNEGAKVTVGQQSKMLSAPMQFSAAEANNRSWHDVPGGSQAIAYETDGGMLGFKAQVGSGWGAGITFDPVGISVHPDKSVDLAGASRMTIRINAPAGTHLRPGLLESGHGWPNAKTHEGHASADGEVFRHEGVYADGGWQIISIPLSEMKINGGYGNQNGNRTIDMQAIGGLELLVPGGQPDTDLIIDWIRLD